MRTVELPGEPGHPRRPQRRHRGLRPGGSDVDILLFLDDDGLLAPHRHRRAVAARRSRPTTSWASSASASPTRRPAGPSAGTSAAARSGPDALLSVTTFLGGANAVRTRVLTQVGGLPDAFFYAHEETDLAWRALDAGWMIDYRSDMVLNHPTTAPSRHAVYHRMVARNRVWLARRNLPPSSSRSTSGCGCCSHCCAALATCLKAWFGGFREGWATPCGPAPAHEVAYGVAADPAGPASVIWTSSYPRASRSARGQQVHARPARPSIPKTKVSTSGETTHDGTVAMTKPVSPDEGLTPARLAAKYGLSASGAGRPSRSTSVSSGAGATSSSPPPEAKLTAQYSQAKLGQLWQVATPLLNALVYFMIFGLILDAGAAWDKDVTSRSW